MLLLLLASSRIFRHLFQSQLKRTHSRSRDGIASGSSCFVSVRGSLCSLRKKRREEPLYNFHFAAFGSINSALVLGGLSRTGNGNTGFPNIVKWTHENGVLRGYALETNSLLCSCRSRKEHCESLYSSSSSDNRHLLQSQQKRTRSRSHEGIASVFSCSVSVQGSLFCEAENGRAVLLVAPFCIRFQQ